MRSTIERETENDSEITLNATTLLGIFFGLVLICGVFFGFGYSTGRRGTATPNANTPAAIAPEEDSAPVASHAPKPSAMESLQTVSSSNDTQETKPAIERHDEDSAPVTIPSQSSTAQVRQSAPAPAVVPKPSPVSTSPAPAEIKPASLPVTPASAPVPMAAGAAPVMVQIAAVSRPEDANALSAALRQRGYNVIVRNESQDKLLHVQVGPFPTREAARAMRAKLSADGYNAILKP